MVLCRANAVLYGADVVPCGADPDVVPCGADVVRYRLINPLIIKQMWFFFLDRLRSSLDQLRSIRSCLSISDISTIPSCSCMPSGT